MSKRGLKRAANVLTVSRFVFAGILPFLGVLYGSGVVSGLGGILFLLVWATDSFDGQLARASGLVGTDIFGKLDAWSDLVLALSGLLLLCTSGLMSGWVFFWVLIIVAVLIRIDFLVFQGIAVSGLVITYAVYASIQNPNFLVWCVVWVGLYLVFFYQRFFTLWRRFFTHVGGRYLDKGG